MASVMPEPGQIKTKQIAVLWFYRRKRIGVKLVYIWINLYKNNTKIFCCIRLVCCQIQTKYTLDTVYLRTYFQFHWLQNSMIQKPFKQEAKKKKKKSLSIKRNLVHLQLKLFLWISLQTKGSNQVALSWSNWLQLYSFSSRKKCFLPNMGLPSLKIKLRGENLPLKIAFVILA